MHFEKPITLFDTETTGLDVKKERIVSLYALKILPDGTQIKYDQKLNPGIPIPLAASLKHGIYDKDVKDKPYLKEKCKEIKDFFKGTILCGYNSKRYDLNILKNEFERNRFEFGEYESLDMLEVLNSLFPRTLETMYKFICQKDILNAHTADGDVTALHEIMLNIHKFHPKIENIQSIQTHLVENNKSTEVPEGKYKGRYIGSEDFSYGGAQKERIKFVITEGVYEGKEISTLTDKYSTYGVRGDLMRKIAKNPNGLLHYSRGPRGGKASVRNIEN